MKVLSSCLDETTQINGHTVTIRFWLRNKYNFYVFSMPNKYYMTIQPATFFITGLPNKTLHVMDHYYCLKDRMLTWYWFCAKKYLTVKNSIAIP